MSLDVSLVCSTATTEVSSGQTTRQKHGGSLARILTQLEKDVASFNEYGSKGYIAYKTPGIKDKKRIVIVIPEVHYLWATDSPTIECAQAELSLLRLFIRRGGIRKLSSEGETDEKIEVNTHRFERYQEDMKPLLQNRSLWGNTPTLPLLKSIFGTQIEIWGSGDPVLVSRMDATIVLAYLFHPSARKDVYAMQSAGNTLMNEERFKRASVQIKALCEEWGVPCEERTVQLQVSRPYPHIAARKVFAPIDGMNKNQRDRLLTGITRELSTSTDRRTEAVADKLNKKITTGGIVVLVVGAEHADIYQYLEKLGFGVVVVSHTKLRERIKNSPNAVPDFLK